jgi:hypothetical protein
MEIRLSHIISVSLREGISRFSRDQGDLSNAPPCTLDQSDFNDFSAVKLGMFEVILLYSLLNYRSVLSTPNLQTMDIAGLSEALS